MNEPKKERKKERTIVSLYIETIPLELYYLLLDELVIHMGLKLSICKYCSRSISHAFLWGVGSEINLDEY